MSTNAHSGETEHQSAREGRWPGVVLYLAVPAVIAALMVYYLWLSHRVVGEYGFPLDDSWIHVRFAQNLARGHGFSFNPGQATSTTTGPLWTLLLALGFRATGEYLFTSAAMNWALCWLTAVTAAALGRTLVPSRRFGAVVAFVVAVTVPLPWLALSGMEPPMFMWLTLVGILLHVRLRTARGAKAMLPTVVFGLGVYARPELLLLFPLAMLDRLLMASRERAETRWAVSWLKELAVHAPVYAVVVAPLVGYNMAVIGRPLPSSYYIKAMNYGITWAIAMDRTDLLIGSLVVAPIKEIFAILWLWLTNNFALFVPFLFGYVAIIRRAADPETAEHPSFLIPLLLLVQPVAWAVATNFHRTPWFQGQRYVANLGPLYIIVGLAGAWWWLREGRLRTSRAAFLAGLALVLVASLVRQPDQARLYSQNVKNITDLQVTAARWLRDRVSEEAVIAANDVGALAVITQCRVFDRMGLVSPETLASRTIENARAGTWQRRDWEAMVRAEPDYVFMIALPKRLDGLLQNPYYLDPVYRVEIDDNITAGGSMAVILPTVWCKHPLKGEAAAGGP